MRAQRADSQALPPRAATTRPSELDQALLASGLGGEALLDRYCALVYRETRSYVETGQRLGLDRRTVKERAERAVLGVPAPVVARGRAG
jgi:hypothetical protein